MNDGFAEDRPPPPPQAVTFDAIMPAAMAARAADAGVQRVRNDPLTTFTLSVLAGAFISFGAIAATTVSAGNIVVAAQDGAAAFSGALPYGVVRLITGLAFCVGLILVIVGGAELFTGNNLIVMAWASRRVRTRDLLRNWVIAFAGNFVGAFATAGLMFFTTQYTFGGGAVGLAALTTAHAKTSLGLLPAFTLGIMCNALVCLAVWMCYGARTTVDRIVTIIPPITAFVIAGFEHCIANIYFIPVGLFIKAGAPEGFWTAIGRTAADFPTLTWENFIVANLIPVTAGNIVGGSVMVAAVYWFIYLRNSGPRRPADAGEAN